MSLHSNPGPSASITVTANVPARRFIGVTGALCGAAAQPIGVSINAVDSGQVAGVYIGGIVVVEAGGAITAGTHVQSDASGKAVAMTALVNDAANAVNKSAIGVALEASTADGQFIRIRLI